jgi:hypothetical protein
MRKSHSTQARLDCNPIPSIELNLQCRDEIIPILYALKHIYTQSELRDQILQLISEDVNGNSSANHGREGLGYWQILVLVAVRLGCNLNYDRLQDLAENHRKLRHVMGIGDWDEDTSFSWQRIRDNICLLKPETITGIYLLIVKEGHHLNPDAAKTSRVDSFVMETDIHHPTESSLIWDGLRKIIELSALVSVDLDLPGWRQHAHLLKKIKQLHREISRVSSSKKPQSKKQLKRLYAKLLKRAARILERAEKLVQNAMTTSMATLGRVEQIRVFIERTRQVADTAYRRVILGEKVPNKDKLFSIFEPHTQLYRRGKAGQENQFGRLAMIYEDGNGFITHHYLLNRNETDEGVAVPQTKIAQEQLGGAIEEISFDRGFYSIDNERELKKLVSSPCLPKRAVTEYTDQMNKSSVKFRAARQRHAGVESAIGALQSGNGLKRSRDRGELGFERYLCLAILGRNLHVLGKMLIATQSPECHAAYTKRKNVA